MSEFAKKWFYDEVISRRFLYSVLCSLAVQKFFVDSFLFLLNVFSWHPILGFQRWLSALFQPGVFFYHVILFATCAIFANVHMRCYSVEKYVYATRLEATLKYFSAKRVINLFIISILGAINVFCYLRLSGCLNETDELHVEQKALLKTGFVTLHGLYTGALFSYRYFLTNQYLLKFTLKQPTKLRIIRTNVPDLLKESVQHIFKHLLWFYVLCVLFGTYFSQRVFMLLKYENSLSFTEVLYYLCSFNLFKVTVTTAMLSCLTWNLYITIFNAFITERYEFLIESTSEENKNRVLCKALSCSDCKLVQYLAFLDLRWSVQFSPERRRKFFAISQPGGHPHLWLAVSNVCISLLTEFHLKLCSLSLPAKAIKTTQTKPAGFAYIKELSEASAKNARTSSFMTDIIKRIKDYLTKKPMVYYFLQELPEARALRVFTTCQPEIWSIEVLAFFVAASYIEDKYGVVQKTLPQIIQLLIDLKLCEEKLPFGNVGIKKYGKDTKLQCRGVFSRHAIKAAVESALYRIVLTFKTDIRGVCVPEDYRRYLERYLAFKE